MNESVERQAGAALTPEAYREFEDLVLGWQDQNQETLVGGLVIYGSSHHPSLSGFVYHGIPKRILLKCGNIQ
jgi:hypothetical protein